MKGLALIIHAACLGQNMSLVHKLVSLVTLDLRGVERQAPIQTRRRPFPNRHKYLNMTDELIPHFPR